MYALALAVTVASLAQAKDEADPKRILFPYYAQQAAAQEFYLDEKHEQRLDLQKDPVLTWTNAENFMGAVFLWTYQGRPELIGCIGSHQYKPDRSNFFREYHSLALTPLEKTKFSEGTSWAPTKPGLELAALDSAPRPADARRVRLTQMRNLAREFGGWMKDGSDVTELRLLPQPLTRYDTPERGLIDGAIFAFVWKGTDPEILLILEDRQDEADKDKASEKEIARRWYYALARFNYRELWVKRGGKEVWRVGVERSSDRYLTSLIGEVRLDDIRAAATKSGD